MKRIRATGDGGFHVVAGTSRSQGATMVLAPGQTTGGPENRHESADQWLFVLSGSGSAEVDGEPSELRPGVVLLIEAGERHEIRNGGDGPLRTFSVYAPPAY